MSDTELIVDAPVLDEEATLSRLLKQGTERFANQVSVGVVNPIELAKAMEVRPQMLYNYIRGGRLIARTTEDTQKIVIDVDVAVGFAQKYFNRQIERQAQIERELRGE